MSKDPTYRKVHHQAHLESLETGENMWVIVLRQFAAAIGSEATPEEIHRAMQDHGLGWKQY